MLNSVRKLLLTGLLVPAAYLMSVGTTVRAYWYCGQAWEQCVTVPGCSFTTVECFSNHCWIDCSCTGGGGYIGSCMCEGGSCS